VEGAKTAKNGRSPNLTMENRGERVFLAAVDADHDDALWNVDDSLAELASLARTAGAEVVGTLSQRLRPTPSRTWARDAPTSWPSCTTSSTTIS
jgi:hypothetical protein